jgi:hypothetical protein
MSKQVGKYFPYPALISRRLPDAFISQSILSRISLSKHKVVNLIPQEINEDN